MGDEGRPSTTALLERAGARPEEHVLDVSGPDGAFDLTAIDAADASFDVVLCRQRLMLAADPAAAAAELRRVLRPDGRAVVVVWGTRDRNPGVGLLLDCLGEHLGAPVPASGSPGPFALSEDDRLAAVLRAGGFDDVEVAEEPSPLRAGSFEEFFSRSVALAGPLGGLVSALSDEAVTGVRDRLREETQPYVTADGGLDVPGRVLAAVARRG